MSEMALKQCGGNDLLEDLGIKNRPCINHEGFQVTDTDPFPPDARDEEHGEKEVTPFREILDQQRVDPKVQKKMHNLKKSNDSLLNTCTAPLVQENRETDIPFLMPNLFVPGKSYQENNPDTLRMQKNDSGIELDLSENQIISLSDSNNASAFVRLAGEIRETDSQKNDKLFHPHDSGFLSSNKTIFLNNLKAEAAFKRLDMVGQKLLKDHRNLPMAEQSVFDTIQASEFAGSNISDINSKELPAAFKSLSQQVLPEKANTPFAPPANVLTNTEEKYSKHDVSKINGDTTSQQNISIAQQTKNGGNLPDNFTLGQDNAHHTPDDTQRQKTLKTHSFSVNTQTVLHAPQTYTNEIQNSAGPFFENNRGPLSSRESLINSEIQTYHSSSATGTEQLHGSIMEQLFQKIRLVNHDGRSEIKVHLTPPELGSIKINFVEENGGIEAKIFVEDAEVKVAIENNLHRLKESVAAGGIEIHKLEVLIQQDNTHEERSSENAKTKNQQYFQGENPGGSNEGHHEQHNKRSNETQKEFNGMIPNRMVDYFI